MMKEDTESASDKRMQFVGAEAYEAADGTMLRDLFQSDNGGWVENVALLDRLVTARLQGVADEIANEGWKWVEAAVNLPYDANYGMRELTGEPKDIAPEEQAAIDALEAEQAVNRPTIGTLDRRAKGTPRRAQRSALAGRNWLGLCSPASADWHCEMIRRGF